MFSRYVIEIENYQKGLLSAPRALRVYLTNGGRISEVAQCHA